MADENVEKEDELDTETDTSLPVNATEDDFWDFLGEEDPFAYVPPLTSETQAYLDWESTASRDRFSDEYSLQRFPGQGPYGLGNLTLPEWFPPEYATYANSLAPYYNRQQINRASTTPDTSYEALEGEDLLAQIMEDLQDPAPIIGITPNDILTSNTTAKEFWNPDSQSFVPNPNFDASTVPNQFDQVINDTTFLYDPTKVRTLSGESIADQEWFTDDKQEVLRAYFADVLPAYDPAFLQDSGSIAKSLVWGEVRQALAAGVDPDAIWAKLKPMSEKPHDSWASSQPLAEGGEAVEFQVMTAEHSLAKFDEFTNELAVLRATDPDIYQETYAYLPLQDKLRYLNDLQSKGSLTEEEYEGLYIQEVNALYDPEKTPNNYRFVEIEGEVYLDTSGSRELNIERDLFEHDFYPDTSDPLTKYNSYTSMGPSTQGTRTEDFDSDVWDFLDPIVNLASLLPGIGSTIGVVYTAIKGLSGETLHTSDWLRAAPGIIEGVNFATGKMPELEIPKIPTQIKVPGVPIPIDIKIGGPVGAEMTREGSPLGIPELIEAGTVLSAPTPSTIYNPDGTERTGAYGQKLSKRDKELLEQGVILNMTQQMTEAGVPIPEGAFEIDPNTGMFININGEPVGFKEIYKGVLDLFREEKPQEFAVAIVEASENEATAEALYATLGDAVIGGAKFLTEAVAAQSQEGSLVAQAFEGTAFGDLLKEVDQFVLATALSTGGQILNNINGVWMLGQTNPENSKIAEVSRHFMDMADTASSEKLIASEKALQEFQDNFEDKVYFEQRTTEEIKNSSGYQAVKRELDRAVDSGSMTAERRDEILANNVADRKNNTDTYNEIANGAKEFFGGMAKAPLAFSKNLAGEVAEEGFSFLVGSKIGLAAKGILKTSQALGRRVDVKDLTDDILAQIDKAGNWVTAGAVAIQDTIESVGGSGSEAYNSAMATQEKVETEAIRESDEFKALIATNSKLVESGAMTEDQFQQAAKDYTKAKLNANDGELRRSTIAANIGLEVGIFGGVAAIVSNKVFGTQLDDKVLKDIFGVNWKTAKELGDTFTEKAQDWAARTGRNVQDWFRAGSGEFFGEGAEEGGVSAFKNILLHAIDPSIEIAREVTGDTLFGATTGLGTTVVMSSASALANAGISVPKDSSTGTDWYHGVIEDAASSVTIPGGSMAANAAANFNPAINNALTATDANGNLLLTEQGVADVFASAGLTPENSASSYATLMNHVYDGNYVSPTEASQAFYESNYVPSQEEIDAYIGNEFNDESLGSAIDAYVDPRQLTSNEVREWAASTGIELTDEQVAELAIQYPDSFETSQRLLDLLGDGRTVTDVNGNSIPDKFEADTGDADDTDDTGTNADTDDTGTNADTDDTGTNADPDAVDDTDDTGTNADTDDTGTNADPDAVDDTDDTGTNADPDAVDDTDDTGTNADTDDTGTNADPDAVDDATQALIDAAVAEATAGLIDPTDNDNDGIPDELQVTINQIYEDRGYINPDNLQKEIDQFIKDNEFIDPNDADAIAEIVANGIAEGEYISPEDLQERINAAIEEQGLVSPESIPQTGLTQDQLTTALELALGDVSTLTEAQVQAIADDLLGKIPAGATPAQVATAVTEALGDYNVSTLTQDQVKDLLIEQLDTQTIDILEGTAGQLGTQTTDITDITGTQIGASTDAILERANEIESAGIKRDEALSTAINEVSTQLGTTRTELLNRIGETEQTLLTRLGEVESTVIQGQEQLSQEIQVVADFVGKDVGQVTQTDVDFVADILAQQELLADPTTFVPTDQQLQYDVNNDGVIDINDQTMLEQAQAGQDVDFARMFNPTGLYEVNQQTQQDIQTAQDLNTQQNLNTQQQIESTRARQQQERGQERLARDLALYTPQTATTNQMGVANIDYLYDIGGDSVFAPNARTNLFSPYGPSNVVQNRQPTQQPRAAAQGGLLSRNNELLRLLGED